MKIQIIPEKGHDALFFRSYHLVNSLLPDKKIILGNSVDKLCRFCGKKSTETTFNKVAHVIPEFMGNKYCFSNFECDNCNEYFGKLENSLFNYAGIFNIFSTVKGKKGYPKFKDKKENYEIFAEDLLKVKLKYDNFEKGNSFILNESKNKMFVEVYQPGYIPQDVFKSLVKIALCMMDSEEIFCYNETLEWLKKPSQKSDSFIFTIFRRFTGEKTYPQPMAFLYRKLNDSRFQNFPTHTFVIYYGTIEYQIFIPFCINDKHLDKVDTVYLPVEHFLIKDKMKDGEPHYAIDKKHLGGIEKVSGTRTKFNTGFNPRN